MVPQLSISDLGDYLRSYDFWFLGSLSVLWEMVLRNSTSRMSCSAAVMLTTPRWQDCTWLHLKYPRVWRGNKSTLYVLSAYI
jgi:hypothetical protein